MVSDPASSGISIESAPPVLRIQIQRPERRNAIHGASFDRLAEAFEAAMSNDALRVIQLTAEGEHFCAGADLEISNAPSSTRPRTGHMVRGLGRGAHRMIRAMHECPVPIVAGVRSVECDSVKWATRVKPIRSILIRQVIIIVIVIVIKEIII